MIEMILPIDFLKTFLAAIEIGNFTRAAEVVHRTQSAVSMQMKRLEKEVGKPLFKQSRKAIVLTDAGELLREHAIRIVQSHDDAIAAFKRPALSGKIRFGVEEDYSSIVLPDVLSKFSLSHAAIRVDVYVDDTVGLKSKLDKGELDFALCTEIMGSGKVVHHEPTVWVTSPHHLIHEKAPLPIAVYHDGCIFRKWTIEALEKHRKSYRIVYVSTSISGIIAAVESGLAVAPLGLSYMPKHLKVLGPESGFPLLPIARIVLHKSPAVDSDAAIHFERHVTASFRKIQAAL